MLKILYKSLIGMVLRSFLSFFILTLFCTMLIEYALKSNIGETNIYYFIALAQVRIEHLLPFCLCLSFCVVIHNIKHEKWSLLLKSLTIKNKTIYKVFWLCAVLHIFCLAAHYQYSYAKAKHYITFQRFTSKHNTSEFKILNIMPNSTLAYLNKVGNRLDHAYIIKDNKIEHYCSNIILTETHGIGLKTASYTTNKGVEYHDKIKLKGLNLELLNNQRTTSTENIEKSLSDTISSLKSSAHLQSINRTYLQKELIQKILLALCPLLILGFIQTHYKRESSTSISGFFLASTLYFVILFLSRTYTILLKGHLIQSISSLFYLLLAIPIYFITKNTINKKIKRRYEQDRRVLC